MLILNRLLLNIAKYSPMFNRRHASCRSFSVTGLYFLSFLLHFLSPPVTTRPPSRPPCYLIGARSTAWLQLTWSHCSRSYSSALPWSSLIPSPPMLDSPLFSKKLLSFTFLFNVKLERECFLIWYERCFYGHYKTLRFYLNPLWHAEFSVE